MIRAAILSLVLSIASVGSVAAGECGKICSLDWWHSGDKPTEGEVAAEIATVDVKARDTYGLTPLHWIAARSTVANITALLEAGASVNTRSLSGSRLPLVNWGLSISTMNKRYRS